MPAIRSSLPLVATMLLVTILGTASAEESKDEAGYLRVTEVKNESVALEMAVRTFKPREGEGPTIGLIAVAHVADGVFYETIQDYLAGWDLVLYESVMPAGARGPGGDTDDERIASTRAALGFVAALANAHAGTEGRAASSARALFESARGKDVRYGRWLTRAMVDAWGNEVLYAATDDGGFSLRSLGADGKKGGEGAAADIVLSSADEIAGLPASSGDGIQGKLAEVMGLEFQLTALDYGLENWVCSDLAMDEVDRELKRRGEDFGVLQGTLSGSSVNGQMVESMLNMMPMIDAMLGGGAKDLMKILLIETLGDDSIAGDMLEQQMGSGFMEVIIGERNQAVIDDLAKLIQKGETPESIAILYGAAHMNDMEERLDEQLGYERDLVFWMQGIEVDLANSPVSPGQIKMIRRMLKSAMRRGR